MAKAKDDFNLDIKEMAEAGLHFGHKPSKTHPKMKPFVYGTRNSINLIDLEKTKESFEKVLKLIEKEMAEGKILLLVGTKVQARKLVEDFGKEHNLPYVSERWLGGTISNFSIIKKRIDYFNDLQRKKEQGELQKYTKKERGQFDLELERLEKKFEGIRSLEKLPDIIFVLDTTKDSLALKEAKAKEIVSIGVCDVNSDPSSVDFAIPANDDSVSAIKYVLGKLAIVVRKGKKPRKTKEQDVSSAESKEKQEKKE
jgi:small subunit ribosomal protein S2